MMSDGVVPETEEVNFQISQNWLIVEIKREIYLIFHPDHAISLSWRMLVICKLIHNNFYTNNFAKKNIVMIATNM